MKDLKKAVICGLSLAFIITTANATDKNYTEKEVKEACIKAGNDYLAKSIPKDSIHEVEVVVLAATRIDSCVGSAICDNEGYSCLARGLTVISNKKTTSAEKTLMAIVLNDYMSKNTVTTLKVFRVTASDPQLRGFYTKK